MFPSDQSDQSDQSDSGCWRLAAGISFANPRILSVVGFLRPRIFLFQLRHSYRPIESRPNRRAFDSVARRLDWSGDFLTFKERMNPTRGFLAFCHSIHNFPATIRAVA